MYMTGVAYWGECLLSEQMTHGPNKIYVVQEWRTIAGVQQFSELMSCYCHYIHSVFLPQNSQFICPYIKVCKIFGNKACHKAFTTLKK